MLWCDVRCISFERGVNALAMLHEVECIEIPHLFHVNRILIFFCFGVPHAFRIFMSGCCIDDISLCCPVAVALPLYASNIEEMVERSLHLKISLSTLFGQEILSQPINDASIENLCRSIHSQMTLILERMGN